jgi:hypothetical protein
MSGRSSRGVPWSSSFCDLGPERREAVPDLRVLVVGPGPRSDSRTCVTAGCWAAMEKDGHGLEFVMTAHVRDQRFIDLMTTISGLASTAVPLFPEAVNA